MVHGEGKIFSARLGEGAGWTDGSKQFSARFQTHGAQNVVAVVITLIEGRGGGAGRLGHAPHSKGFFASPGPQPASCVKDAPFELRIRESGQRSASSFIEITTGPDCFDCV